MRWETCKRFPRSLFSPLLNSHNCNCEMSPQALVDLNHVFQYYEIRLTVALWAAVGISILF